MSLLLLRAAAEARKAKLRGRWGVHKILYLVPKQEQHSLEWWQRWLADHWEEGG